ncbi:DUF2117 family protein [Methanolobus halotolerans]|uniref:DUF2117 domain-containing protein n=1 Tax=Methanolobus halotolerans TaxID=2052935 RepID=A0A4E0Q325_9EURY|nr:DUF2117 domain-containing protein [Methanolobus halotolerans]TGC07455.1 hypothetical protein CUN85_11205 [Methanolobus halotolerans]
MEIGIVIHGPDIVDSGMACDIIKILQGFGRTDSRIAGAIGKTAVLDAHLEKYINISSSLKPSECIEEFFLTKDAVVLLNQGKNVENGRIFGNIVVSNIKDRNKKPLIQIESPSKPGGEVIPWNICSVALATQLSQLLGTYLSDVPHVVIPIRTEDHGRRIIRKVHGVHPGEKIFINGIIVGQAISEDINIVTEDGFITEIKGAQVKEHGLEKLHGYEKRGSIDITRCWIKSGPLRGNGFLARRHIPVLAGLSDSSTISMEHIEVLPAMIKAVIIDHEAERTFELADNAQVAITIGDDTTEIAGDILFRLEIPIIGITDGDLDGFSHRKHIHPGSVIFRVSDGHDDIIGRKIRLEIFRGYKTGSFNSIIELKEKVRLLANRHIKFSRNY